MKKTKPPKWMRTKWIDLYPDYAFSSITDTTLWYGRLSRAERRFLENEKSLDDMMNGVGSKERTERVNRELERSEKEQEA